MQTGKCIRKRQITLYTLSESTVTRSYNIGHILFMISWWWLCTRKYQVPV